jgi:hypothetical protein
METIYPAASGAELAITEDSACAGYTLFELPANI